MDFSLIASSSLASELSPPVRVELLGARTEEGTLYVRAPDDAPLPALPAGCVYYRAADGAIRSADLRYVQLL